MPSNHLILCRPLLLLPSIFPSIWVFCNESVLCIRWPKYWRFSFGISPSVVGNIFHSQIKTSRRWSFYYPASVRIKGYLAPGGNCLLPAKIQWVLRFLWIKTTGMLCDGLYLPRYLNRSDSFSLSHVFSQSCVLHITFWFSAYSIIKLFHSLLYSVQRLFWKGQRFFGLFLPQRSISIYWMNAWPSKMVLMLLNQQNLGAQATWRIYWDLPKAASIKPDSSNKQSATDQFSKWPCLSVPFNLWILAGQFQGSI